MIMMLWILLLSASITSWDGCSCLAFIIPNYSASHHHRHLAPSPQQSPKYYYVNHNNNMILPRASSSSSSLMVMKKKKKTTTTTITTTPSSSSSSSSSSTTRLSMTTTNKTFELTITLPGKQDLTARMKFQSVFENPNIIPSEIIEVRYKVPFGLNVEPRNNMAICTKDGPGGEKVGDILRYTSQWTLGLPRGEGVIATAMSFSGGISWQCSMFDVMRATRWESVVEALTSNVENRTDEVVLLFERPLASQGEKDGKEE